MPHEAAKHWGSEQDGGIGSSGPRPEWVVKEGLGRGGQVNGDGGAGYLGSRLATRPPDPGLFYGYTPGPASLGTGGTGDSSNLESVWLLGPFPHLPHQSPDSHMFLMLRRSPLMQSSQ